MNLHEFQSRDILAKHNVSIPVGYVASTVEGAVDAAKKINAETGRSSYVIKAQVHSGGRGKAGGVKFGTTFEEVKEHADAILGMTLVTNQTGPEGKLVRKVLITEQVYEKGPEELQELYFGILLDRNTGQNVIMYSPEGGMDIEEVSEKHPEKIFTEHIDPTVGLTGFQLRNIAFNLGFKGDTFKQMMAFTKNIYAAYEHSDASMVEINPLIKSSHGVIMAVDAKVAIDDNALVRHPDLAELRDIHEEDPAEVEAGEHHMSFVKLSGNVGCMVNGAGLAMATMDAIKLSGGEPANFLDVGGGANAKTVEAGLRIILKDPNVELVFINIFGGIVRCDRVAGGVVEAYKNLGDISVPLVVRLQGTNAEVGAQLIRDSGLQVHAVTTIEEATAKIKEMVG